jgi:Protein of unknown function (DUF817)
MGGVRTSIFGRPRHLPRDRRADPTYTLICEEPVYPGEAVTKIAGVPLFAGFMYASVGSLRLIQAGLIC